MLQFVRDASSALSRSTRWFLDWFADPLDVRLRKVSSLPPLVFRPYTPDDFDRCMELYRLNEEGRFPDDARALYARFLKANLGGTFMVELEGERVATCGANLWYGGTSGCLSFGLIHPDHHCKGIGTAILLSRLVLLSRKATEALIMISLMAVDDSMRFYRKFGFLTRCVWTSDGTVNEHHMERSLNVLEAKSCEETLNYSGIQVPDFDVPLRDEEYQKLYAEWQAARQIPPPESGGMTATSQIKPSDAS